MSLTASPNRIAHPLEISRFVIKLAEREASPFARDMSLSSQLNQLREIVLDLLFPCFCIGCGGEGELICASCRRSLPRIESPFCLKCGIPLDAGDLCPNCEHEPPLIDGIRSPFPFDGLIKEAVHQLKYKNLKALAHPLARLLGEYLGDNPLPGDVLVPVPLHNRKVRRRGYNQSSLLARELGRLTSIPVVEGSLVRKVNTPAQAKAESAEERRGNVSGAFSCDEKLRDSQVLLIDDVSTTGATLESCAVALMEAGAASVWGLTIAREI